MNKKTSKLSGGELSVQEFLPEYGYHVTDTVVSINEGEQYMFTYCFKGVAFEAVNESVLDALNEQLNTMFLRQTQTKGARVSFWTHLCRSQAVFDKKFNFQSFLMKQFNQKYMERFVENRVYENRYYLTVVLKNDKFEKQKENIQQAQQLCDNVFNELQNFDGHVLSIYEENDVLYSEVLDFLSYLQTGMKMQVPLPQEPMFHAVPQSALHFKKYMVSATENAVKYATLYDVKTFPSLVRKGQLNAWLNLDCEFAISQSLCMESASTSIKKIKDQRNKIRSAGDEAVHQIEEMDTAIGFLTSNEIRFGEYCGSILIFASSVSNCQRSESMMSSALQRSGLLLAQADLSAPETYFSVFPGNYKHRPRKMPKTTRNLACMWSLNNYSFGKSEKNPLGDGSAVIPFLTDSNGVYHFNFHYTMRDEDSRGKKIAGHTFICGQTGSGKTTFQSALVGYLDRFNGKVFAIDKDRSMDIFIRSMGGVYFTLDAGVTTGLNPFLMPDSPETREYLTDFVMSIARPKDGEECSSIEIGQIQETIQSIFENVPREHRRLGLLVQYILPTDDPNCLHNRLLNWVYTNTRAGKYAHIVDNTTNLFDWDNLKRVHMGFDVTYYITNASPATEAVFSMLFQVKNLMQKQGGLMATVIEECWLPARYPQTYKMMEDILNTGRKKDEIGIFVTLSPNDMEGSPLLEKIVQQMPTKLYLANPDADKKIYTKFGVTDKEFNIIRYMNPLSRQVLIKQGGNTNGQSAIVNFSLPGMDDEIAALAGSASDHPFVKQAIEQEGTDPEKWLPVFWRLRKGGA